MILYLIKMKTKLLTICFLLFTSQVFAGCQDDFSQSWTNTRNSNYEYVVRSKTDKTITLTRFIIFKKSGGGEYMHEEDVNIKLKPYGKISGYMYVGNLTLHYAGGTGFACKYTHLHNRIIDKFSD